MSSADRILKDYRPETRALLATLAKHGFTLRAVDDGEELTEVKDMAPDEIIDLITGVEECRLRVTRNAKRESLKTPGTMVLVRYSVLLVFGNSPGELVCNYGIPADAEDAKALEAAVNEHAARWETRTQPTATARQLYPHIYANT